MYTLHTDGGSRGNPGPSGCAFVISENSNIIKTGKFFLGTTTNNQAEYMGAILGLTEALQLGINEITLIMDSELVIKQLQGIYRVKDVGLKILHGKAKGLITQFKKISYMSVLRAKNQHADKLANEAMDARFPLYDMGEMGNQLSGKIYLTFMNKHYIFIGMVFFLLFLVIEFIMTGYQNSNRAETLLKRQNEISQDEAEIGKLTTRAKWGDTTSARVYLKKLNKNVRLPGEHVVFVVPETISGEYSINNSINEAKKTEEIAEELTLPEKWNALLFGNGLR